MTLDVTLLLLPTSIILTPKGQRVWKKKNSKLPVFDALSRIKN